MLSYPWPGNVRELRNMIEWAVFMHDNVVLKEEHLRLGDTEKEQTGKRREQKKETAAKELDEVIGSHVQAMVENALASSKGNKTAAAEQLGISRRKLYRLLEKMN